MRNKVRLNKFQVEDIKKLVSEYGSKEEAVEAHTKMMMLGYEWTSFEHLNDINPQTLDIALRYGYDIVEWESKELSILNEVTKRELIDYIGINNNIYLYECRKECYKEIKIRREKGIDFVLYKSLNDVDLELLAKALGLCHSETFQHYENNYSSSIEVRRIVKNKNKSKVSKTDEIDKKITLLEIDYELASLQIALEKGDEEEAERCKENLKNLTKKQKDAN